MKKVVLVLVLVFNSNLFFGQALVQYGNQKITRDEFLAAFRKNNAKGRASEKAYREYLELYIRYRLKVQAALDSRMDTLPGQVTELQNFKDQIVDQYTNDEASLTQLADEAFGRSQQDIRVSYIFVAVPKNASPSDTARAWKKIQDAQQALRTNIPFNDVAMKYSEDPAVNSNRGDIGFITVFDLPYVMETAAYQTRVGQISPVIRTEGGLIILKKVAERKAEGRIRIAQILVAFPYQANETGKADTRRRADSIYKALLAGADFGEMARKFSGDNLSYQLGGVVPEFGIGKYEAGYEQVAFGLKKDGAISTPYQSSFGYHIIKRIARKPIPAKADQKQLDELKEKIKTDPRVAVSRSRMLQYVLKETRFKEYIPSGKKLWDYTDSALAYKKPATGTGITDSSILFQLGDKKFTTSEWVAYRRSLNSVPNLINGKKNPELLDSYRQLMAFQYYKEHLENYNAQYAAQIAEFRDGNLLFDIMQQQIWNRASADSTGLKAYFDTHAKNYWWKPGAEAILFNTPNQETAGKIRAHFEKNIRPWRTMLDTLDGRIQADSGRFDAQQIPAYWNSKKEMAFRVPGFTANVVNPDKTIRFAYIIRLYTNPSPRTFEEARGMAISDFQNVLENQWITELKKKYPVVVNEKVFSSLPK